MFVHYGYCLSTFHPLFRCPNFEDEKGKTIKGKQLLLQEFEHDRFGNVVKVTSASSGGCELQVTKRYSELIPTRVERLNKVFSCASAKRSSTLQLQYDRMGNVEEVTDDKGNVQRRLTYNCRNKPISSTYTRAL